MENTDITSPVSQVLAPNAVTKDVHQDLGVGAHVENSSKTEEFDAAGNKIVARLTPDQYWEWRTTAAELQLAERELDVATAQATILTKELEIARLRVALHGPTAMAKARMKKSELEAEYQRFKSELEAKIGTSLTDKVIDETFAVKDLRAVESNKEFV